MRMDRTEGFTAADLVNRLPERELADLIYRYGEEHASRRIARAIVDARRRRPLHDHDRAGRGRAALGRPLAPARPRSRHPHLPGPAHPRQPRAGGAGPRRWSGIAGVLAPGGRLAVIAFHSLEDREVKQTFRALARRGLPPPHQEAAARPADGGDARATRAPAARGSAPSSASRPRREDRQLAGRARGRPARQPRPLVARSSWS